MDSASKYLEKKEEGKEPEEVIKDLPYWKNNAEEDYLHTPISVLKYISKLEKEYEKLK